MDHTEKFTDMSTFNRVKRYRKPLTEIDQKIKRLEEGMTTSGFYNIVRMSEPIDYRPPLFEPAPLGDFNGCFDGTFTWADQGDGSAGPNSHNLSQLDITDLDGNNISRLPVMPPTGSTEENGDYPEGANPKAMIISGRAFTGFDLGYLNDNGFNFVRRINNVFGVPYTPFSRAFEQYYADNSWHQCTIYLWSPLDCLFGQCYGASQYYPADKSNVAPHADYALYAYSLLIPASKSGNPNYVSRPTVNPVPPRVTDIVQRNPLGHNNPPPPVYTPNTPAPPENPVINFVNTVTNIVNNVVNSVGGGGGGGGLGGPGDGLGGPGDG